VLVYLYNPADYCATCPGHIVFLIRLGSCIAQFLQYCVVSVHVTNEKVLKRFKGKGKSYVQ